MSVLDLIVELKEQQISLELNGDDLKISGPKEQLTAEVIHRIRHHKQDFLSFLKGSPTAERDSIPVLPAAPLYPASYGQKSLWLEQQLGGATSAYNMFNIYEWPGELELPVLNEAVGALVDRHEILRTVFVSLEDEVWQKILPYEREWWSVALTDLSDESEESRQSLFDAIVAAMSTTVFDLGKGPLARGHIVRWTNDRHLVLLVMHHIISDAWSMEIFIRELNALYTAAAQGRPASLPPVRVQYKEYAHWHNSQLSESSDKDFWLEKFSGELPTATLDTDCARPRTRSFQGETISRRLPPELSVYGAELAARTGCSRFSIWLAAYTVLLYRYTGQSDLVVGIPVSGRGHPELEQQLGYFVNTVALRVQVSPASSFPQLAMQVHRELLDAYTHQSYPFARLVEDLEWIPDPGRSPLFEVLVNYQSSDRPLDASPAQEQSRTEASKFDLSLDFIDHPNGLQLQANYDTVLFRPARIRRLMAHYVELFRSVIRDEQVAVSQLSYIPYCERQLFQKTFNPPPSSYPKEETVMSLFEAQVKRTPEATAVIYDNVYSSYDSLNRQANRLAHYLRTVHHIQANDRIALVMDRTERMMVALMGILKSGAAYVPIDPAYPAVRQQYIRQDSSVRLVMTEECYSDGHEMNICWESQAWQGFDDSNPAPVNQPSDLIYLLYTSGTTGQPKGVCIRHESVVNHTQWLTDLIYTPAGRPLRTLLTGTINFDASVEMLFPPLVNGSSLELVGEDVRNDLSTYLDLLLTHRIEVLNLIPSHLHLLLQLAQEQGRRLDFLHTAITGGEVLQQETVVLFQSLTGPDAVLINGYGPTETTVNATYLAIGADTTPALHSIGIPISNTEIYILDDRGAPTGIGVAGEICIGGAGLANGYWNFSELTEEKFREYEGLGRLYHSGDRGCWSEEGTVLFYGRMDSQVKIRGYRIELSEIEQALLSMSSVREAVVTTRKVQQELQLIAYIVWKDEPQLEKAQQYLLSLLPVYMVPDRMVGLPSIPRTPNGKLDRRQLPAIKDEAPKGRRPMGRTEEALARIWEEVLDRKDIRVTDHFFVLGGHSLKGMRMTSRIRQELGVAVVLRDIFQSPTIAELALVVDRGRKESFVAIEKIEDRPYYELSHAQRRLWLLSGMEESSLAYNMFSRHDWHSELDADCLDQAFLLLAGRHEILRTRFISYKGVVMQEVLPVSALSHYGNFIDLSSLEAADRNEALQACCHSALAHSFDLEKGPLWIYRLVKLEEDHHVILLTLHHIISDAWSMEVLVQELNVIYQSLRQSQPHNLPELSIQYRDYAHWHNRMLEHSGMDEHRVYWLKQLEGELPVLELPADHPRPRIKQYGGRIVATTLPAALKSALEGISRQVGCSFFTVLVASVKALLFRYTGQQDIITGIPLAGREHKDLEDQLGFYINTIALRTRFEGTMSFLELVSMVHQGLLEAHTHQLYPFDRLLDDLALPTDRSRSPLFDLLINHEKRTGKSGATSNSEHADALSKFDLSFHFAEYDEDVELILTYNPALYDTARIDRLLLHFQTLLCSLADQWQAPIQKLAYLPLQEYQLLEQVQGTKTADTLADVATLLEEAAIRYAGTTAVRFHQSELSYEELNAAANRLAHYLRHRNGWQPGSRVGLMMQRSERMVVAIYAVLKAGGIYVPLDPAYPAQRTQYILADSGVALVLTDVPDMNFDLPRVHWNEEDWQQESESNPSRSTDKNDLIYLLYTSGSTGQPKGVCMPHGAVSNLLVAMRETFYKENTSLNILLTASISFDVSVGQLFAPLIHGSTLVLVDQETRNDPQAFLEALVHYKVQAFDATPSYLQLLLQLMKERKMTLPSLHLVLSAGETLPVPVAALFHELFEGQARLVNAYGPTEACVYATSQATSIENLEKSADIGRPLPNYEVHVLDAAGHHCGIGITGELCIGGAGLATGYWNRPEATEQVFINHPELGRLYRTGDFASWTDSGELRFAGRKDNQVKIRGFRIELAEVEEQVLRFDGVREAAVLAIGEPSEKELVGFVCWEKESLEKELVQFLSVALPAYMVPQQWVTLDELPKTGSGKIDRKSLPLPQKTVLAYTAPATRTESILCSIWQDALGKARIGIDQNFFDAGGHSLKAMRIISTIYHELEVKVTLKDIFISETVRRLAALIDSREHTSEAPIPVLQSQKYYPLSHAQERIWVQCQHEAYNRAYLVPASFDWAGPLDEQKMQAALNLLVSRHEVLRTVFVLVDGIPLQQPLSADDLSFPINFVDYTDLDLTAQAEALAILHHDETATPFALEAAPLFRMSIAHLDPDRHRVLLTMHHIISDAWSLQVFGRELQQVYEALSQNREVSLSPLRFQYKDFASWQRTQVTGELDTLRRYWNDRFSGELPVLDLPTDFARNAVKSFEGRSAHCLLSEQETLSLQELKRQSGASMFSVLVAVIKALLYRYTGQDDLIIGMPVAGRGHRELEGQLGCYINTLAVRTVLNGQMGFDRLLAQVHLQLLSDYEHQSYPFDLLIDDLLGRQEGGHAGLFDVLLNYERREGRADHDQSFVQHQPGTCKFDWSLHFTEYDNGIQLSIDYDSSLFLPSRIDRLLLHFRQLVQEVIRSSSQPLDALDYLTPGEKDLLLHQFNESKALHDETTTIHQQFELQAARTPEAAAVYGEQCVLTYDEVNSKANQLAHYLRDVHGITPDDRVGIMMDRNENMIVVLIGILKSGAAYVPIDPNYPAERCAYLASDSGVKLLLAETGSSAFPVPALAFSDLPLHLYSSENPELCNSPEDTCYIIYTSGSTGKPKGVSIRHRSVINLCTWLGDVLYKYGAPQRVMVTASISFDASVKQLFPPLLYGHALVIISEKTRTDPERYLHTLQQHSVQVFDITPSYLHLLVQLICEKEMQLPQVRHVLSGGEMLQPETVQLFFQAFGDQARLLNVYGPTETCVDATFRTIGPGDYHQPQSIGKPVNNAQLYILDKNGLPAGVGIPGEVCIGGAGLAVGYWNRPELTEEKFRHHEGLGRLYHTGDRGAWSEEGEILFYGRVDNQVKIRGYRIELSEIERVIQEFEPVREAVVIVTGRTHEKELAAYLVWKGEAQLDGLRGWLKEQLPPYMLPAYWTDLPFIPRTPGGKINRLSLPAPKGAAADESLEKVAPSTPTEEILVGIWQELMDRPSVGVTQKFFDLGGHSLKAMRMISKLYQHTGARVSIRDIFQCETIRNLAALIDRLQKESVPSIHPVEQQPHYALSHAQQQLWLIDQMEGSKTAYNIFNVYSWNRKLDLHLFRMALQQVVTRHEVLRTVFITVDGEVRQQVQSTAQTDCSIAEYDFSSAAHDEQDIWIEDLAATQRETAFDLDKGPLFRVAIVRRGKDDFLVLLTIHHIISDAWSIGIMLCELAICYDALEVGASAIPEVGVIAAAKASPVATTQTETTTAFEEEKNLTTEAETTRMLEAVAIPLEPLPFQYKDFAAWHNNLLRSENINPHRLYWLQTMEGELPILELPADNLRPPVKTYAGATYAVPVEPALVAGLQELARQEGCSMFTVLLACTHVLLCRYAGTNDLITGIPVAGRDYEGLDNQLGYFINTLAFRNHCPAQDSFTQFLRHTRDALAQAYAHQWFPFDLLVDELELTQDRSRSPLFDVMINYDQRAGSPAPGKELTPQQFANGKEGTRHQPASRQDRTVHQAASRQEPVLHKPSASKFDLLLHFTDYGHAQELSINYNIRLFAPERIERMAAHFQRLVRSLLANTRLPIFAHGYLTEPEKVTLYHFSGTGEGQPAPLVQTAWEAQVAQRKEQTALVFGTRTTLYEDFNRAVNRAAHALRTIHEVRPNDRIGIMMQRSDQMVAAICAVLKSGAAYVPLDPAHPKARRDFMIRDSQVRLLITETFPDVVFNVPSVPWLSLETAEAPDNNPSIINNSDDLAYIIYTSGSTGQPKGVCVGHGALANLVQGLGREVYLSTLPMNVLLTASVNFDVSVGQLFTPLTHGHTLVVIDEDIRMDPQRYVEALITHKIDVLDSTPSFLHLVLQTLEESRRTVSLRKVLAAGEALLPDTCQLFRRLLPRAECINLYGPTEACVYATLHTISDADTDSVSIGRPLPRYRVFIFDAWGNETGIGMPGEICIGGIGLAQGYWNRPELTAEKFTEHPRFGRIYHTGDVGRWNSHGEIDYLGRKDSQVKINGVRIELGEIETAIQSHPSVREAVVAVQKYGNDPVLVAYVVWKGEPSSQQLQSELSEQLPIYMVPRNWIDMKSMPRNASGKLNRRELPSVDDSINGLPAPVLPSLPLEQQLCLIWEEVLGKKNISIDDHLFALGGHSLKAMRIVSRIYQDLGMRVTIKEVFEAPTVRRLAAAIGDREGVEASTIKPIGRKGYYELSAAQRRLWILAQVGEADVAYNMFNAYEWQGEISVDLLRQALGYLIERHEILRTVFVTIEGKVYQEVRKPDATQLPLQFFDISNEDEPMPALMRLASESLNQVFQLDKGPLLNLRLVRISERQHAVLLCMHHIISDAWSIAVLLRELTSAYTDFASGGQPSAPALTIQYKDFAHWQNGLLSGLNAAGHKAYWHEQLQGNLPVLELPADFPRPRTKTYSGATIRSGIDGDVLDSLHLLGEAHSCSLFTIMVACFKTLLFRYTTQEDIIIGIPVAGRDHSELEQQIGYYVNTIALRTIFSGDQPFSELLNAVRTGLLEGFTHQAYPLDQLVEELKIPADRSRSPLFDVMCNYEKREEDWTPADGQGFEALAPAISKFDLVLHLAEFNDRLSFHICFNTDIYKPERIERMIAHLHQLVLSVVADPTLSLSALDCLPPAERLLVQQQFNDTARLAYPLGETIVSLLAQQAPIHASNAALVYKDQQLSYEELHRQSNALAHYLIDTQGLAPGDRVGVMMEHSHRLVIALLAVLKCGAVYIPLDAASPASRLDYIREDCGWRTLITENNFYQGKGPHLDWDDLRLDENVQDEHSDAGHDHYGHSRAQHTCDEYSHNEHNYNQHNSDEHSHNGHDHYEHNYNDLPQLAGPNDLCYIIYTSGSTGLPKGVMIEHHSLVNLCCWHAETFGLSTRSRATLYAGIGFDASVWELWPYLLAGACLYPVPEDLRHELPRLMELVRTEGITHSFLPTPVFEELCTSGLPISPDWCVLTGGDQLRQAQNFKGTLVNNYGPTECTVVATSCVVKNTEKERNIPIGNPIANTEIFILDASGQPSPIGIPGELYIGGPGVARGYINQEELSAQKFGPNPFGPGRLFRTGDMGCWRADGQIEFLGRKDGQVKLRGYRIETGEIETALERHAGLTAARVLLVQKGGQPQLAAFYSGQEKEAALIRRLLDNWLPPYMIPAQFIHLNALPLTLNGKIDDAALRRLDTVRITTAAKQAPQSRTEKELHAIWKELLQVDELGTHDDFFELGGHSLRAIRLIAAIDDRFRRRIGLKDIFNRPTIKALAQLIEGRKDEDASLLVQLNRPAAPASALYLLPPVIGSSTVYHELAGKLQGQFNCYGWQYPGFDTDTPFCDSIEALGAAAAKEIAQHNSSSTINILGYSFGAWVAFETARALEASGHTVRLILVDKEAPHVHCADQNNTTPGTAQQEALEREMHHWQLFPGMPGYERIKALAMHNYTCMKRYAQTGAVAASITAFQAKATAPQNMQSWLPLTTGGLEVQFLDADHFGAITGEELAAYLMPAAAIA